MRIDLYGSAATGAEQVSSAATQAGKSQTAVQPEHQAGAVQPDADRTTLSSGSLSVASLTSQALAAGGGRSDRVEALRQSVNSGDYQLEPDAIAQAILKNRA